MARKTGIPQEVRNHVIRIVEQFNAETRPARIQDQRRGLRRFFRRRSRQADESAPVPGDFVPRFRGRYLYLDRAGPRGQLSKICRLAWTGEMDDWEFAIYKYSSERYDQDDWFFPGSDEVDGTIEGALRAAQEAYP